MYFRSEEDIHGICIISVCIYLNSPFNFKFLEIVVMINFNRLASRLPFLSDNLGEFEARNAGIKLMIVQAVFQQHDYLEG